MDAVDNFSHSLSADGGNLTVEGAVTGGGLDISGATLTLGSKASGVTADFLTGNGELKLEDAPGFNGPISGFGQAGNEIDLTDVPYVSGETKWSFTENKAGTEGTLDNQRLRGRRSDHRSAPAGALHRVELHGRAGFSNTEPSRRT